MLFARARPYESRFGSTRDECSRQLPRSSRTRSPATVSTSRSTPPAWSTWRRLERWARGDHPAARGGPRPRAGRLLPRHGSPRRRRCGRGRVGAEQPRRYRRGRLRGRAGCRREAGRALPARAARCRGRASRRVRGGARRARRLSQALLIRLPALPANDLVRRAAGLRATARDRAPAGIGRRGSDRDEGDHVHVRGYAERRAELAGGLPRNAGDARGEPLVDRGEEEEHERCSRVDEPVRNRPVDLVPVLQLVGLAIALVVVVLTRADEDVDGRRLEPRLAVPGIRPAGVAQGAHNLRPSVLLGHDEQALALAVARARRSSDRGDDSLHLRERHAFRPVVPHHPPARQELTELHRYRSSTLASTSSLSSSTPTSSSSFSSSSSRSTSRLSAPAQSSSPPKPSSSQGSPNEDCTGSDSRGLPSQRSEAQIRSFAITRSKIPLNSASRPRSASVKPPTSACITGVTPGPPTVIGYRSPGAGGRTS